MSDDEPGPIPTSGAAISWTFTSTALVQTTGALSGLGCVTGIQVALCSATNSNGPPVYDQPYMYALNPLTGQQLWNSGTFLDRLVSLPLIDAAGNSYMSDDNYVVSFDPTGNLRWRVANPATGTVLEAFNTTNDGYLVSEGRLGGPLVVLTPTTGTLIGSLVFSATVGGVPGAYVTQNHLSVAASGQRLYTVTQFQPASGPPAASPAGRLYAVDVVNGVPQVAWYWDFVGPSTASPLTVSGSPYPTIYFDGRGLQAGQTPHPWYVAVQDRGTSPALLWADDLTAVAGVAPHARVDGASGRDPRGGVWTGVTNSGQLFRLDQASGALLQTISIGVPGYQFSGARNIALNNGRPMLVQAAQSAQAQATTYLLGLNLTSSSGPSLWKVPAGTGPGSHFQCQFPLAATPGGPIMLAVRQDGTILGLRLQ